MTHDHESPLMSSDGRLLGNLSVLVSVVETGNFARAADALGLSPSGVSRAVSRLEERLEPSSQASEVRSAELVQTMLPRPADSSQV